MPEVHPDRLAAERDGAVGGGDEKAFSGVVRPGDLLPDAEDAGGERSDSPYRVER